MDRKARKELAEERVEAGRAAVAGVLEGDAEYRSNAEEHSALMDRRDRLKSRRAKLLAVAALERPNYDGFAPFRYLSDRDYGEPEYRVGWISRLPDRWLAKRVDFRTLYRHHRLLKVGPHQIQAEIVRSSRRAGELETQMDATEEKAAESWGGVINRMNEAHFHRPIAESMLGGILSELASSFSASAIEHEYAIDSDGESIISTVVRDDGSSVVTRRVTRRRSVYGTGLDEG